MVTDAIIDKPKKVASRLGTFGEILYSVSPKTADQILSTAYRLFPDSKASKGDKAKADGEKDQEMSTEAIAMAYLMRGVHF